VNALSKPPQLTLQQIKLAMQQLYDCNVIKMQALPGESDQNRYIESAEGGKYILKITSTQTDKTILEMQNKALAHISTRYDQKFFPRVYASVNNTKIETLSDRDGTQYYCRLLSYLPGKPLARLRYHHPLLIRQIGNELAMLTKTLQDVRHPASQRELIWDLSQAEGGIEQYKTYIHEPSRKALIEKYLSCFQTHFRSKMNNLRQSVIYNDANNYNILVNINTDLTAELSGFIDWGDLLYTFTLADLAVALAYIMMDKTEPLQIAKILIEAYHQIFPLTENEVNVLLGLILLRLCLSVSLAAYRRNQVKDNPYLAISEQPAWELLEKLARIHPRFIQYSFRQACGFEPHPDTHQIRRYLQREARINSVLPMDLQKVKAVYLDLSVASNDFDNLDEIENVAKMDAHMQDKLRTHDAQIGVGGYREPRAIYTGDLFRATNWRTESRTVHIGMDLYQPAETPVLAPLAGRVHSFNNNQQYHDYGPTVILAHTIPGHKVTFYTLYGHLSLDSLDNLYEGKEFPAGDQIAKIGGPPTNGDWPPHLHFQIMVDMFDYHGDYPGVAKQSELSLWETLCPDPNLILRLPVSVFPAAAESKEHLFGKREKYFSRALRCHYQNPLRVVRGYGQYLYDAAGKAYLDMVNNVAHVGHSHPRIVAAACRQLSKLNTNTRYLYDQMIQYGERICALLPDPLEKVFFVNSGSEANDLALRIASSYTGHRDVIVLEDAYHGNLSGLIAISPYKYNGPGGKGASDFTHEVKKPDGYRGPYKRSDPKAGYKYAASVRDVIKKLEQAGLPVTFMSESLMGCGGQIIFPDKYLQQVYEYVRATNGVCIADEVQVGFGRVGSYFWGFETQGVIPDIVTLGKPMGNGYPVAAVVTTRELADHFYNGMEYFNTYGGNPVACAIGLAVLDIIADQELQKNALEIGTYTKSQLNELKDKHELIGDVRGLGLFMGVELVSNRKTLEPAPTVAHYMTERMREAGILVNSTGPRRNVIKLKPPLIVNRTDIDLFIDVFDSVLNEVEIMLTE